MSDRSGLRRGSVGTLLLGLGWAFATAAPASAQNGLDDLIADCQAGAPQLPGACLEGALALQAAQGAAGLLAAGGAQLPGAASTVGRRFGGTPRFSIALLPRISRGSVPDVREGTPSPERSYTALTLQSTAALGLLDGFSVLPTVGGILSLDVFANAGVLLLPAGPGFEDSPFSWGGGARVGLLRESFTLPGVTISGAYRWLGGVELGTRAQGDALEARVDPTVTSFRGVVGKDLVSLGLLGGVGWDRYGGEGRIAVSGAEATGSDLDSDRWLFFAGASFNLLLLQLSAEGGWAGGFDEVAGRPASAYDPTGSSFFLSLAGRLTL